MFTYMARGTAVKSDPDVAGSADTGTGTGRALRNSTDKVRQMGGNRALGGSRIGMKSVTDAQLCAGTGLPVEPCLGRRRYDMGTGPMGRRRGYSRAREY